MFMSPRFLVSEEMQHARDMRRASSKIRSLETSEFHNLLAFSQRYLLGSTQCVYLMCVIVFVVCCFFNFSRILGQHIGETPESPLLDPCLPTDLQDEIGPSTQTLYLRGTGDFDQCRQILQPFLNRTNDSQTSLSGIYQPAIDYSNSQFYGFSEFYYCTEDVLRMGGDYNASKYSQAAKVNATLKKHHHETWVHYEKVYFYDFQKVWSYVEKQSVQVELGCHMVDGDRSI